jgi:hypothetical protein
MFRPFKWPSSGNNETELKIYGQKNVFSFFYKIKFKMYEQKFLSSSSSSSSFYLFSPYI